MRQINEIFDESQEGVVGTATLVKQLTRLYKSSADLEAFFNDFISNLKCAMVVYPRHPAVEHTIEFAAKFIASFGTNNNENKNKENCHGEDDAEVEMHPLVVKFCNFLLENHDVMSKAVRFRVCQLLHKLLSNLGEDAQIDDDLYTRIHECMLERMRDKFPTVRVHAILALSRLQDATDPQCQITKAYIFLMQCDRSPDVRRAALSVIRVSQTSLAAIVHRTRDARHNVQRLAYQTLADKVHMRALTIAQRVRLLDDGLKSKFEDVRDACGSKLLQFWLNSCNGSILTLLKGLDVEGYTEAGELVVETLLKKIPKEELVKTLDVLNKDNLIPKENLTSENGLLWRCLLKYVISLGPNGDTLLDKLAPLPLVFSKYFLQIQMAMQGDKDLDTQMQNEFLQIQLLGVACLLDMSDNVGRNSLIDLVHQTLLHNTSCTVIPALVQLYDKLVFDPVTRINKLIEVISDIRMPIDNTQPPPVVIEETEEQQKQRELQLAKIRVQLNEAKEELQQCIKAQEFTVAADLKKVIAALEESKLRFSNPSVGTINQVENYDETELRTLKTDPVTWIRCLTITAEMMVSINYIKILPPSLRTLIDMLVLAGIQQTDPAVRNVAVRSLGLICLLDQHLAIQHLMLLLQICKMDVGAVRISSIKVVIDFLHLFGLKAFGEDEKKAECKTSELDDDSEDESDQKSNTDIPNSVESALEMLISMTETETGDVLAVVVEGLAKLFVARRIHSWRLFSRLLLLWYNPVTEEETFLRHCLGTFFPLYAFASRDNQGVIQEAFLPTIQTLLNAPASSPLSQVNIDQVAVTLTQLTNVQLLKPSEAAKVGDSFPHDSIAESICNAILSAPNSFNVKYLCRVLGRLQLCPTNSQSLKCLSELSSDMLKEVKERQCVRALEKFHKQVKEQLQSLESSILGTPGAHCVSHSPVKNKTDNLIHDSSSSVVLNDKAVSKKGSKKFLQSLMESPLTEIPSSLEDNNCSQYSDASPVLQTRSQPAAASTSERRVTRSAAKTAPSNSRKPFSELRNSSE